MSRLAKLSCNAPFRNCKFGRLVAFNGVAVLRDHDGCVIHPNHASRFNNRTFIQGARGGGGFIDKEETGKFRQRTGDADTLLPLIK